MKLVSAMSLILAALTLAGCQTSLTLEEAQAMCAKQGGLLVVIYTQKITRRSVDPVVASPGNCVSPGKFDKRTLSGARAAPAPAASAAATGSIASNTAASRLRTSTAASVQGGAAATPTPASDHAAMASHAYPAADGTTTSAEPRTNPP